MPGLIEQPGRFKIGGGWGDHISFVKDDAPTGASHKHRRVYGHLPVDLLWADVRFPEVGDLLGCEMQSGRVGVFRFIDVHIARDPHDMFTGSVEWIGYVGDPMPELGSPTAPTAPAMWRPWWQRVRSLFGRS